jgi:cis-3-alkyl-4-acyloxetan-2-one decarboxylase
MIREPAPPLPRWLERSLPFERYLVDVGGYRMHVMEAGVGVPVLMVHGNPTWGFLWRKVAEALHGEQVRLIIPDLVGLGLSDKPRDAAEHTLDAHGRWLGALLDQLRPGPLVLVAQDWGGPIGLLALADRRELAGGLVLLNTVVGPPRDGFRANAFHRFARLPVISDVVFRALGFPQLGLFAMQGDRGSLAPWTSEARAYRWPLRRMRDNVAPLALARMVPDAQDHPSIPALRRCQELVEGFRGPAAVVWGTRDPVLGRVVSHVERLLPAARVTRTAAGHFLQEEVPDTIADAVRHVASQLAAR